MLLAAGFAGGVANAVAGGGIFFVLPAMLAAGTPAVAAGASSAVAVWPGHAGAVPAGWRDLGGGAGTLLRRSLTAGAGAVAGALLLRASGDRFFAAFVPWLTAAATLLFACGPAVRTRLARRGRSAPLRGFAAADLLIGVYGGYFGAGLGVLLLALLEMAGEPLPRANAMKNILAAAITSVAAITYGLAGMIAWAPTSATLIGALLGGYAGGRAARRAPAALLRALVILSGALATAWLWTGRGG